MTKYLPFVYDEMGYCTNQKCFIITGKHLAYLTAFLGSSLFKYIYRDNFPELMGGTRELSKVFFDEIVVKQVDDATEARFAKLLPPVGDTDADESFCRAIDSAIFDVYGLTETERAAVGFIEIR
jgi:hypothetical protein